MNGHDTDTENSEAFRTNGGQTEPDLAGRVALVTGASRGIGAATAKRLAELGADVGITYLKSGDAAEDVVQYCRDRGVEAEAFRVDAAEAEGMKELVPRVVDRFGSLDVLVNNAGYYDPKPVPETDDDEFDRYVNTNMRSVYLASREAAEVMPDGGRIVNISSIAADRSIGPGLALYGMSKAGVAAFTRGLANDLGEQGITVNAVQPGPIDTDMNPADGDQSDFMRPKTALKRYGQPEEVADVVAFLAGPESSYVTGATINVAGGINA